MISKCLVRRDRFVPIAFVALGLLAGAGCQETVVETPPPPAALAPIADADSPPPAESPTQEPAPATSEAPGEAADANSSEPADPATAADPATGAPDPTPGAVEPTPDSADPPGKEDAAAANPDEPRSPFAHRINTPDFPKDMEWLNVAGPLRKQDLRGKFVLLDFWTYCCINCIHILPELKQLEKAYPNELVVIGVHSAKFETEKGTKNIEEAILRYEIEHPVVNDAEHQIWDSFGVRSWPTAILIDPQGFAVWGRSGEFQFEEVDEVLKLALPHYRKNGSLDETPVRFELVARQQKETPLRFPGKVLADEAGGRLFISDSNHNRIVVTDLDGKLQATIGSGEIGRADGDYASASFDHPQGMALRGSTLYVADTENHMLRKVDLEAKQVTTLAGTGEQGKGWPGIESLQAGDNPPDRWVGKPATTDLNSPWDLLAHGEDLYIAMAGPHQIWKMPLDEREIGPYAGNGREDIVDGPLVPRIPYEQGYSSFAQPSGLASDGKWLYVADSEGSSIRAVPFDPAAEVKTVVGTAELPFNRLFHFGDKDGPREQALLQHALGVAHIDGQLFVADTYNNKIKTVDAKTGETKTLAGTGKPGKDDAEGSFDEPSGISAAKGSLFVADTNNHLIRTVDPASGKVGTLTIDGLEPPKLKEKPRKPDFSEAKKIAVEPVQAAPEGGVIPLQVTLELPKGWKVNDLAPMRYWVEATGEQGPITRDQLGEKTVDPPAAQFEIPLTVTGNGAERVQVSLVYYYCQDGGEGICKVGSVVWDVPLQIADAGSKGPVPLKLTIEK